MGIREDLFRFNIMGKKCCLFPCILVLYYIIIYNVLEPFFQENGRIIYRSFFKLFAKVETHLINCYIT